MARARRPSVCVWMWIYSKHQSHNTEQASIIAEPDVLLAGGAGPT